LIASTSGSARLFSADPQSAERSGTDGAAAVFAADDGEDVFVGVRGKLRRSPWFQRFVAQFRPVERGQFAAARQIQRTTDPEDVV